jgi:hypothetical protein
MRDLVIICPDCCERLAVDDDLDPADLLWLHQRRCTRTQWFPELIVVCPACKCALPMVAGLSVSESLWMHEHDCLANFVEELWSTG